MNGLSASMAEARAMINQPLPKDVDVILCPPATLVGQMVSLLNGSEISVGGQDCHEKSSGAFTGDISAEMLKDVGCDYCIIGHSERRQGYAESNEKVAAKTLSALTSGLKAIVCVGETLEEKDAGKTLSVLHEQITGSIPLNTNGQNIIVGYEPIWAIGSGRIPELSEIEAAHEQIRASLEKLEIQNANDIAIIYGGSVKPNNAAEILALSSVDGALVGGASLKADDFLKIIHA